MNWQFNPFVAPLFVGAALMLAISTMALIRRGARGSIALFFVGLAAAAYQIGYAFEVGSTTVEGVRFWLKVEYLGILTGPALILILVLAYTGRQRVLTPLNITLLFAIPAVMTLMVWTNDQHQLIWRDITIDTSGGFTRTLFERAPWYWLQVPNTYLNILVSLILLVRSILNASGLYRRQLITMLVGVSITVITHIVYLTGVVLPGLDINPYMGTVSALVIAWSILSYQLLDIVPIAYESVVASINDAVIVADAKDRLVDLNPAAAVMLGMTLADTVSKPVTSVFPQWGELRGKGGITARKELALTVHGHIRHFDASLSPITTRGGRPQGHLVVLHDVTERTIANQRLSTLRDMESELTQKLNVEYVAAVAVDSALRLCHADAAYIALPTRANFYVIQASGSHAATITGQTLPRDQGIAKRVIVSREPEMLLDVTKDADYLAVIPTTRAQMTLPLVSKQKTIGVLVLETANPQQFTPESFETIKLLAARIASAMDNATLYEERDLLASELETFAHSVAHDLKNPLGVIVTYADFGLNSNPKPTGEMLDNLAAIERGARKGMEIVNSLLLLSSARSKSDISLDKLNIGRIVENVCDRIDEQLKGAGAILKKRDMWPNAVGYEPWVEAVWVNLITNAIKYGGKPPVIDLDWDKPSNDVIRYWVGDNGRGLSKEEIGRLFQPFSRLETGEEGHGLGLTIVQRIAERLGGSTGVESRPGRGSHFYFTLPAELPGPDDLGKPVHEHIKTVM